MTTYTIKFPQALEIKKIIKIFNNFAQIKDNKIIFENNEMVFKINDNHTECVIFSAKDNSRFLYKLKHYFSFCKIDY
ncbi:MAG: hypothetical protein ACP5LM_04225 [Thermoplasmata archaeon]